jgi:hypothetical protein
LRPLVEDIQAQAVNFGLDMFVPNQKRLFREETRTSTPTDFEASSVPINDRTVSGLPRT